VFNDIAVAALVALEEYGLQRLLVLDLDVHQGNGTSAVFEREPRVVTFDMHGGQAQAWRARSLSAPAPSAAATPAPPGRRPSATCAPPPPPRRAAGDRNYPWSTRMRSTYDLPLPDGTGDGEYLELLRTWLPRLMEQHTPQLIFFQAGVDALEGDRWAAGAGCGRDSG
jgi:acetoin utilization deacetylase AcuC-like enzyme